MSSIFPPEEVKKRYFLDIKELPELPIEEYSEILPGWRPWTFSTTTLLSAVFFTAGLTIVLGLLEWQNFRNGALFMVSTTENFSNMQNFLYRYLPTIIIVLYGMGWSWIDLDIKRLEPWYQLSHPDGASADKSLLLEYPLDFMPLVPFKAAKRKQWAVLSASTIMVLVAWAVTPLQNGIFSNSLISRSDIVSIHTTGQLISPAEQNSILGINFMTEAYSTLWLGQPLPSFTTMEYAIAPFQLAPHITISGSNQTLTATTNLYGTQLDCKSPAKVTLDGISATFDDGHSCLAQNIIQWESSTQNSFDSYFISYWADVDAAYSLQSAGCGPSSIHTTLTIWKRAGEAPPDFSDTSNATALFCTASYYKQEVNATVSMPDKRVLSSAPVGPRIPITEPVFNITLFEDILANGAVPTGPVEITQATILHQNTQVANMTVALPVPNMIAFAIGSTHYNPEDYLDPENLAAALQKAYSLLFTLAVSSVMEQPDIQVTLQGTAQGVFQTVSLVPLYAILSQAVLLLIAAFTCFLLFSIQHRITLLNRDPGSLADVMSLARSSNIRHVFNRLDSVNYDSLTNALKLCNFRLFRDLRSSQPLLQQSGSQPVSLTWQDDWPLPFNNSYPTLSGKKRLISPLEYHKAIGLLLVAYLSAQICTLAFLRFRIKRDGGLPLPSENKFIQQLVLNFVPTLAATLLEPVLVLISRLACLMQPLEELREGKAKAKTTLMAKYTSLPSQLIFWRAFRNKRIPLACLCFIAILANLLTVALSGILVINDVTHSLPSALRPLYQAKFPAGNITTQDGDLTAQEEAIVGFGTDDAFYVANSNFSTLTLLPAWTTPNYFFPPMNTSRLPISNQGGYWNVQSRGYGADLDCSKLSQATSSRGYELDFSPDFQYARLIFTLKQQNGSELLCRPFIALMNATGGRNFPSAGRDESWFVINGDRSGRKAFEMTESMLSINDVGTDFSHDPCDDYIVKGWVRVEIPADANSSATSSTPSDPLVGNLSSRSITNVSSTFLSCRPRLKSAMFDLSISSSGSIFSMSQTSTSSYDVLSSDLEFALKMTRSNFGSTIIPFYHNDTVAYDWPNHLMKLLGNSTSLLDASVGPPTFQAASNLTSEVFSRLFAIQMSLSSSQLVPAGDESETVPAQFQTNERRVFMSENLFCIAIIILSLDLVVVLVFYWRLPKPFLPRLPTSIASQIAFFAGSHVIDDVQAAGGSLVDLDKIGYRYGYGKYVGKDGSVHVGIEREPYVTSLDVKNDVKCRRWGL